MNNLTVYKFNEQPIRTIPYQDFYAFCLSDCLKAVSSGTSLKQAVNAICENIGDKQVIKHNTEDSLGRNIMSWFVTESAITFLVSRSRTELGRKFNRWLHTEVLPAIRATGHYSISSDISNNLSARNVSQNEVTINEVNEAIEAIFTGVHIKKELIAGIKLNAISRIKPELTSVVEESRQLLIQSSTDDCTLLTPTKLGEELNLSGQKVNKLLIEKGLQIKNENRISRKEPPYLPTDYGKEFSTFTLSTGSNGDSTSYQQLRWFDSVLSILN